MEKHEITFWENEKGEKGFNYGNVKVKNVSKRLVKLLSHEELKTIENISQGDINKINTIVEYYMYELKELLRA